MKKLALCVLLAFAAVLIGCNNESMGETTEFTTAINDSTTATASTAATIPSGISSEEPPSSNVIIRPSPTYEATNPPYFVGQDREDFFGEVPDETKPTATVATTPPVTTPPSTMPPETTPPETIPSETAPEETTETPREYIPQDPDTTEYPEDSIQATMTFFAGMLYVNDNREDTMVKELPNGYIYVGVTGNAGSSNSIPRRALVACNVPEHTEFYGSMEEPDYIYYELDGKYRRMIRAGLVENYWDDTEIDPDVPKNYTELFFESLLTANFSQNRYHCATYSEFDTPEDVDLNYLFYSGFYEERQKKLTEAEEKYLISDGWNKAPIGPVSNAKRLPVWRMDGDLRRFFGISFDDISGVGINQWQSYWSETGCYYVWRSGSIGNNLKVDEVVYDENTRSYAVTYTMELYGTKVMTLRLAGDTFRVLSNKVK